MRRVAEAKDLDKIGIGEIAEHALWRAVFHAQHDQALLDVSRIAREGNFIFFLAVFGVLISRRQQRDSACPAIEALSHPGHETRMAKILVLQPGFVSRLADYRGYRFRERLVRFGASARDEIIA